MDLKQKVEQAFNLLQRMEIVAAKKNVDAISYALIVLQEVHISLDKEGVKQGAEAQKEGVVNGEN